MKILHLALLCLSLAWFSPAAHAADAPSGGILHGKVVAVKDAGAYTYLEIENAGSATWAAMYAAPVHVGQTVTLEHTMVMHDFTSKALGRTFASIVFGVLAQPGEATATAPSQSTPSMPSTPVARATGANAMTVGEIVARRASLSGKAVTVRGRVVKYNPDIMGRNWVHLRDGSGSASDASDDLLVTTADTTKVGDVVTAQGVVRINQDFGAGYAYRVMLEHAKLHP